MITVYAFGPNFGLPQSSPFVMKAEVLLRMADLPYRTDVKGFFKAPKGKLPYIDDDGEIVADSTFIRLHIEKKYGFDFDKGLSPAERGVAWAFEKLCEEHLYWLIVHARWMDDANFAAGPRDFFAFAPAPLRPIVERMVRRQVRRDLHAQGLGRHTDAERTELAARDLAAISDFLADKPCLMGEQPCGADASVFAMVASCFPTCFATPVRSAAESHPNLVAYRDRLMGQYFPAFANGP